MSTAPDLSRRALCLGHAAGRTALRPPWALDEADFLDCCTGCGACIERCPEGVLVRGPSGYPMFEPARGACTFCGACAEACAPHAIDRSALAVPWQQLAVVGDACLPRHGVVCASCRDACPVQAIAFPLTTVLPLPVVATECCTGCGACVGACPVHAIELRSSRREAA